MTGRVDLPSEGHDEGRIQTAASHSQYNICCHGILLYEVLNPRAQGWIVRSPSMIRGMPRRSGVPPFHWLDRHDDARSQEWSEDIETSSLAGKQVNRAKREPNVHTFRHLRQQNRRCTDCLFVQRYGPDELRFWTRWTTERRARYDKNSTWTIVKLDALQRRQPSADC